MMVRLVAKRVSHDPFSQCNAIAHGLVAIESRVARIKARVAELTSNLDASRR